MNTKKGHSPLPETVWNWKKEVVVFALAMAVVMVALLFGYLLDGKNEHKFTLLEKFEERISFAICWPTYLGGSLIHGYLFLPERLALLWTPRLIFSAFLSGLFWTAMVELCFRIKKWISVRVASTVLIFIIGASFFATWNWHPHSNISSSMACINNLRIIDGAKNQWALENGKTTNDTPTWADILPYMGHAATSEIPECPDGGESTIGRIGENPKCSIGGNHSLQ